MWTAPSKSFQFLQAVVFNDLNYPESDVQSPSTILILPTPPKQKNQSTPRGNRPELLSKCRTFLPDDFVRLKRPRLEILSLDDEEEEAGFSSSSSFPFIYGFPFSFFFLLYRHLPECKILMLIPALSARPPNSPCRGLVPIP